MWVFTVPIEEKNIRAVAGMPVPPKYAKNRTAMKFFKEKYGEECIKDVGYWNTDEFTATISDAKASEQITALRAMCDEQAKTIKSQAAEIASLKKQVRTQ